MIDFHSHILPEIDDGASSVEESLAMLRQSFRQGVILVASTSHFYPDEDFPKHFLERRAQAYQRLQDAMLMSTEVYPRVVLGAEVLYFPGISEAREIAEMRIGKSRSILVEPPMTEWSDGMLDEIAQMGENFRCTPVIAHVDRYMRYLGDRTLIDRVRCRDMAVQVNADYFLNPKTAMEAFQNLMDNKLQAIGSDCHNMSTRPPNIGLVWRKVRELGLEEEFHRLHQNAADLLLRRGG